MPEPSPNPQPKSGSWLNPRRVRAHALVLMLMMWTVFAWDYSITGVRDRAGQIKGADFLHFYTIGLLAREHRGGDLYNMAAQAATAQAHIPEAAGVRYLPLYPPQVSLLFAPLASFEYGPALFLWSLASLAIYGLGCAAILRTCPALRKDILSVVICVAAYPAFWHLIAWGQTPALALGCFTMAYFALRKHQRFLAGLALGCLIYKPQLGLASALVCAASGEWEMIAGGALSAFAQLGVVWIYYGTDPLLDWWNAMIHVRNQMTLLEPKLYQTHSLRTFWTMLLPWPRWAGAAYGISAALVVAITVKTWRSKAVIEMRFCSLLLATVLISPHLTVYDLVILAPALLLLAERAATSAGDRCLPWLIYFTYALPLLGPLTRWTHVQLSVAAMAALLAWCGAGKSAREIASVGQPTAAVAT